MCVIVNFKVFFAMNHCIWVHKMCVRVSSCGIFVDGVLSLLCLLPWLLLLDARPQLPYPTLGFDKVIARARRTAKWGITMPLCVISSLKPEPYT